MVNYKDKNILVVDDDHIILRVTKKVLENIGFNDVKLASNARQGLRCLSEPNLKIDIILLDLKMPDMDGIEMLRKISEMQYHGDLILFSGEDEKILKMTYELALARKINVIGTIRKPIEKDKLLEILEKSSKLEKIILGNGLQETVSPSRLQKAIELESIEPWFQPIIELKTNQIIGVEALARWPVGINSFIPPVVFIPLAEKNNLIENLTKVITKKIISNYENWTSHGLNLNISINISKIFLSNINFPYDFENWFESNPNILKKMTIEISETDLKEDVIVPLDVLLRLNLKKIRLYLDNFGTGSSNFTQLKALPFNEMKIDCKYVHCDLNDKRSEAILKSSVELAKKLEMKIVAEGVETEQQLNRVKSLECDYAQGFYLAEPMPGNEIIEWTNKWYETHKDAQKNNLS